MGSVTPLEIRDGSRAEAQSGESLAWIQDVVRDLVRATTPEQVQRATSLLAGWGHLPDRPYGATDSSSSRSAAE